MGSVPGELPNNRDFVLFKIFLPNHTMCNRKCGELCKCLFCRRSPPANKHGDDARPIPFRAWNTTARWWASSSTTSASLSRACIKFKDWWRGTWRIVEFLACQSLFASHYGLRRYPQLSPFPHHGENSLILGCNGSVEPQLSFLWVFFFLLLEKTFQGWRNSHVVANVLIFVQLHIWLIYPAERVARASINLKR